MQYQHKFGDAQRFGLYGGIGVKFQFPFSARYKVKDGDYPEDGRLNVSGFYESSGIDFGSPENPSLSYHGFGTIHNPEGQLGWKGDVDLKMSITGTAEFGFLITLGPYVGSFCGLRVQRH